MTVACGATEPFLRRLLRALNGLGLLEQDEDGRYRVTASGEQMRSDRMGSAALFFGGGPVWSAWGALEHAVKSNKPFLLDVHVDAEVRPPATGTWHLPPTPYKEPAFGQRWLPEE